MTDERLREAPDGVIREGSLTPGGNRIGSKAWRLIVTLSEYDDYLGAVLDVIDEAALATTPETPTLDVDILQRAVDVVCAAESIRESPRADDILAEYARLSQPTQEPS